jgi:hypothetical protein
MYVFSPFFYFFAGGVPVPLLLATIQNSREFYILRSGGPGFGLCWQIFHRCPQSLQEYAIKSGHDRFLSPHLQFINH